ncbi:putative membrane protein YdbT with pleckstrin-like domain [Methanohalophilus levihalophilus]|nr:putative membrane protein YdbT with pleckstrin-like domain [Methanohalophilus levihalophilus]
MIEIEDLIIGLLLLSVGVFFIVYVLYTGGDVYLLNMKDIVFAFILISLFTRFSSIRRTP